MQVLATGKNIDIGDSLRQHLTDRLTQNVAKYFEGAVSAHVTIEKQRSSFSTECSLHLATGLTLQAHGEAGDAYSSFDTAAEHLEKRLRRYKRRLRDHHLNRREPVVGLTATSYIIDTVDEGAEEPEDLSPAIIAENSQTIAELTVGEAVMQLDISTEPFALFRNASHGGLNVVYRRKDGNIGWVDPGPAEAAKDR
jgi:ribosomal subunit interface protein